MGPIEKDFQVSCQHVEPVDKTKAREELRTCRDCKKTFPILQYPPKGGGRRESRCGDCHNTWRRSRYAATAKRGPYAHSEMEPMLLDENHSGFNTLLDLVCDEIIRKEVSV